MAHYLGYGNQLSWFACDWGGGVRTVPLDSGLQSSKGSLIKRLVGDADN